MRLVVITPIGPGHEEIAQGAIDSVKLADKNFRRSRINFTSVEHIVIDDHYGKMGRSKARNIGMETPADWFFFLDADDRMKPMALWQNDFSSPATFGAISLNSKVIAKNVHPCGWKQIAEHGSLGTLSMGFFCKADIARRLRFNEDMDRGEDFEFYMRLPAFTKLGHPLVEIGYDLPSAHGPRGYHKIDWTGICDEIIREAVMKDPAKYAVDRNAVLAKAIHSRKKSRPLPHALPA